MDMAFITQFKRLMLLYSCLNTGLIWVNPLNYPKIWHQGLFKADFLKGFQSVCRMAF